MYQAHFGLNKPLFERGIAQEAAVFLSARHQQVIASSKIALTTLDSAIVLTGTAGVGKTTLISSTLRTTSTRLALGWLTGSPANGAELLELLLVEFGFNAHRVGRVERMQMWRQFLNEMSATESRVFVIVERADDLSHEVLRALDSLTAADPNGCLGANLVLLGQPALLEHLKAPVLESLRQRIRLRERLEPFSADELRAYLVHQVTRAGGAFDKVFAPEAVGTLHKLSGGIPRIANNLCETALTLAATSKESLLTSQLLTDTAAAMFGIDEPPARPAPAAAASSPVPAVISQVRETAQPTREADPPVPALSPASISTATAAPTSVPTPTPAPAPAPIVAATFSVPSALTFAPPGAPTYTPPPASESATPAIARATEVAPAAPTPAARPFSIAPVAVAPPAAEIAVATAPTSPAPTPTPPAFVAVVPPKPTPAPRMDAASSAGRSSEPLFTRPTPERSARPTLPAASPPARPATLPPVVPSRASAAAPRAEATPVEIDSFADTLTESPDVQMADLPVLTDAVEPPARAEPRPRAQMAYARNDTPAAPSRAPIVTPPKSAPQALATPGTRTAAPPPAPSAPRPTATLAAKPAIAAPPTPAPEVSEEDLAHQTQTVRALAAAKSIDDISSSMAETLFGEADLDMLSAAFASAGWSEDSASTDTASPPSAPPKAQTKPVAAPKPAAAPKPVAPPKADPDMDPFDFLGLGQDAPLELIDDAPPSNDRSRKTANTR